MIGTLIAGKLLPWLIGGVGIVVAFFGAYMKGRSAANAKNEKKALETKVKTTERVQNAKQTDSADAARKQLERLSKRGK